MADGSSPGDELRIFKHSNLNESSEPSPTFYYALTAFEFGKFSLDDPLADPPQVISFSSFGPGTVARWLKNDDNVWV